MKQLLKILKISPFRFAEFIGILCDISENTQ